MKRKTILAVLIGSCVVAACVGTATAQSLRDDLQAVAGLRPEEILEKLTGGFSEYAKEAPEESHYGVVRGYMDAYMQAKGASMNAAAVVGVLRKTAGNEDLLPHVLYWLHQSAVYRGLSGKEQSTLYGEIETIVKQSTGVPFQVGVGLLSRLIKADVKDALNLDESSGGTSNAVRLIKQRSSARAEKLMRIVEEHVVGQNDSSGGNVSKSTLDDVQRLQRATLISSAAHTAMLQNIVRSTNVASTVRIRSAERLLAENPDTSKLVELLNTEMKRQGNSDAIKREFDRIMKRAQTSE